MPQEDENLFTNETDEENPASIPASQKKSSQPVPGDFPYFESLPVIDSGASIEPPPLIPQRPEDVIVQQLEDEGEDIMAIKRKLGHINRLKVAKRPPLNRFGERPVADRESLCWNYHIRCFLWIMVLRDSKPVLIKNIYGGILTDHQFKQRVAVKIAALRHELQHESSRIARDVVKDNHGVKSFKLMYVPNNQFKDLNYWLDANLPGNLVHIDRDAALEPAFINGILDDLFLQGISAVRIAKQFENGKLFNRLFGAFNPDAPINETASIPLEVIRHLRGLAYVQEKEGYPSLIECCIHDLAENAPTIEIGMQLLEIARKRGFKRDHSARSLDAATNWFESWDVVYASVKQKKSTYPSLAEVNRVVKAVRPHMDKMVYVPASRQKEPPPATQD